MLWRKSQVATFEEVERAERIFYLSYLRPKMIVFDVGAFFGELTLLFSRSIGPDGCVHAFEPALNTHARLRALCDVTMLRNVRLNQAAVAEQEGSVLLHVYDDAYLAWTSRADRQLAAYGIDVKSTATQTAPAVTIDGYCKDNSIQSIDLLKVDVEGAELQVLQGAQLMLKEKRINCVSFEFGQTTFDMGNTGEQIEAFLDGVGYKTRNLIANQPTFPGGTSALTAQYSMHLAIPKSHSWDKLI
jgi:FkbM family methyltransferase